MSIQSQVDGTGDVPDHTSDLKQGSAKHDPPEKSNNKMKGQFSQDNPEVKNGRAIKDGGALQPCLEQEQCKAEGPSSRQAIIVDRSSVPSARRPQEFVVKFKRAVSANSASVLSRQDSSENPLVPELVPQMVSRNQKLQETLQIQPLAVDNELLSADSQRQSQAILESSPKTMQERRAKAQAEAILILQRVAVSSMPIPPLSNTQMQNQDKARSEGALAYRAEPENRFQHGDPDVAPVSGAMIKTFRLNASIRVTQEPSVYDKGPQMVYDSNQKALLHGGAQRQESGVSVHSSGISAEQTEAVYDGAGLVQLVNVDHRVAITVTGVRVNQGHYEAILSSAAMGRDGRPLPNQVSWVSGKIERGTFHIDQASINNGPPFRTFGILPLKERD